VATYSPNPAGGFIITRDDGTKFASAIPVGSPDMAGLPPPQQPSPIAQVDQAALHPAMQPSDQLVADANQPGPQPIASNGNITGAFDPSIVAGFNSQDKASQQQVQAQQAGLAPVSHSAPGAPPPGQDLNAQMNAMTPTGMANQPPLGAKPATGAVFAKPAAVAGHGGGLPPGYYTTKAGYIPRAKSEQGTTVPDYVTEGITDATQKKLAAQADEVQAMRDQANQDYTARQLALQDQRQMQAQEDLHEQQRQQKIQAQMDSIQKASDDVAAQKIDRDRVWQNGSRTLGIIGMMLGAKAATGPGGNGKNYAMEIVDKATDDDLKEQEANLNNARASVAQKQNILGLMRQNFSDDRAAYNAAKAVKLEDLASQLEINSAQYKDPIIQARGQQQAQDIRTQAFSLLGEVQKTATATSYAYDPGGLHGGPPAAKPAQTEGFAKMLDENKIPDAVAGLDDLNRIVDTSKGNDVPGLGKGTEFAMKHVPLAGSFLSDEGMANRQAVDRVAPALAHALGMKGEGGVEEVRKGLIGDGSARAVKNGIANYRKQLRNKYNNAVGGYGQNVRAAYEANGGIAPDFNAPTQVKPAGE
jgi:hypothetical protein